MSEIQLQELLKATVTRGASDIHLKAMRPPLFRIDKRLIPDEAKPLLPEEIQSMLMAILNARQKAQLEESLWVDLAYSLAGVSRFRVSITHQRGSLSAVFRRIPFQFPSIDDWGLPEIIKEFTKLPDGLVLVTGPTGSGKSSTLAALVRLVADTRPLHVVTIEDPIEFLLMDKMASISQREVGTDTLAFSDALRNVLRQDPDVIVVGEMRDLETTSTVITAAETGHLVFSTLHTNSAAQTIDRIIDAFPPRQQAQVRNQLAQVLQGIICLKLVDQVDGQGLTAAVEVLRKTPRIAKLVSEGNISEIETEVESSVAFFKMQSLNQSLTALVLNGAISLGVAQAASSKPEDFERDMRKVLFSEDQGGGFDMAESKADFSKIMELQEIQRLYEESKERHQQELSDKDRIIQDLQGELHSREEQIQSFSDGSSRASEEVERARREAAFIKQDLESKIAKLQARVKELTASDPASSGARRGFFSR